MIKPIYILSKGVMSACTQNNSLKITEIADGQSYFKAIEPDYKSILQPNQIRRSSRIVKLNLSALHFALATFKPKHFDAVITGTGMGSLEDSERFLTDMVKMEETALSPTPFIQSTHNTVAGQLALQLQATCYNMTYSQRFLTFDAVLKDAAYMLNEQDKESFVLACMFDEVSPLPFDILKHSGIIKSRSNGVFNIGEIALQFILSNSKNTARSYIDSFSMLKNIQPQDVLKLIQDNNADLVISGFNEDEDGFSMNSFLKEKVDQSVTLLHYLAYSGVHFTMNAFGLALADEILCDKSIPEEFYLKKGNRNVNHILFIYPTSNSECSVLQIKRC